MIYFSKSKNQNKIFKSLYIFKLNKNNLKIYNNKENQEIFVDMENKNKFIYLLIIVMAKMYLSNNIF